MTAQINVAVMVFTNGNCLFQDGQRCAGAAVVSNSENTCGGPNLAGMSAQEAELAALKILLELRKGKTQMAGVLLLPHISMGPFVRRGHF